LGVVTKILNRVYVKYLRLSKSVELAKNVYIDYRCEIEQKNNISIGHNSRLYKHTTLYKNAAGSFKLGDHSHIAPYGYFLLADHNICIGDNVAIAKNCAFFCSTNSIPSENTILYKDSYEEGDIEVGNNVFMGANCVVLPDTVIENNVVIGANSTIKGRLEEGYLYAGNPAIKIKKVFE